MRHKLMLLFSFLFLTAVGNAVLSIQLEYYEEAKFRWLQHTHQIMKYTEQLLANIKDAESGQREYLLTRASTYLEPYHRGVGEAKKSLAELHLLADENAMQKEQLQAVQALMELKFAELANNIESIEKSKGGVNEAIDLINSGKKKAYIAQISTILREFKETENQQFQVKIQDFQKHRIFILAALIAEILFFIVLAVITVMFLNKNLFLPLKLLIANIRKMEQGVKIDVVSVDVNDEMGYLLSRFYKMYQKIEERTEQLTYTASHDELTDLNNRVNLYKEIQKSIYKLQQTGIHFAVLYLDLDEFKQFNDSLGHDAGDFILKETANHLRHAVRNQDVVFRVGGDEFVILMNDVKQVADLHNIAEKLLHVTSDPIDYHDHQIQITLSIGIVMSTPELTNSERIVTYADIAMYEAKHQPHSSYQLFDASMLKRSSDPKPPNI